MVSLRWWRGFALGGLLVACFPAPAAAQTSPAYANAVKINAQYRQNQAQIKALMQNIATNEAARARWRREIDEAGPSVGKLMLLPQYTDSFAAANRSIESDRATLALLERRQTILERSWSNNGQYSGYYGDLRETANRTIYDPQTRKTVNLMDYRVHYFRNPAATQAAKPTAQLPAKPEQPRPIAPLTPAAVPPKPVVKSPVKPVQPTLNAPDQSSRKQVQPPCVIRHEITNPNKENKCMPGTGPETTEEERVKALLAAKDKEVAQLRDAIAKTRAALAQIKASGAEGTSGSIAQIEAELARMTARYQQLTGKTVNAQPKKPGATPAPKTPLEGGTVTHSDGSRTVLTYGKDAAGNRVPITTDYDKNGRVMSKTTVDSKGKTVPVR
jgi:flagellar biosynthesis chaperone FliJ